jgi:predicted alpha/beta superfamily hydrolase
VFIAILLFGAATRGAGQSRVAEPVPAPGVSAFTFASPAMGETYEVIVGTVFGSGAPGSKKYPALILTDGYGQFETAHAAARSLVSSDAVEPMLIISIGAPVAQGGDAGDRRRVYEFSPPGWAMTDPFGKAVTSFCARMHSAAGRCTGGAPAFLGMIVHELLPRLAERFPIDTARLGLYGLSAGGFFAQLSEPSPNDGDPSRARSRRRCRHGARSWAANALRQGVGRDGPLR